MKIEGEAGIFMGLLRIFADLVVVYGDASQVGGVCGGMLLSEVNLSVNDSRQACGLYLM